MQLRLGQNSILRPVIHQVVRLNVGLVFVLMAGLYCNPVNAAEMDEDTVKNTISLVTEHFSKISDADTRNFSNTGKGRSLNGLVEDGLLDAVPEPPPGTGTSYEPDWKSDPAGTNKDKEVEYITMLEVSDDFCKEWNNAKHPKRGKIIMPSCQEAKGSYTCSVKKPGVNVKNDSPPDQCGQTCCVAGNVILFKNGYINTQD